MFVQPKKQQNNLYYVYLYPIFYFLMYLKVEEWDDHPSAEVEPGYNGGVEGVEVEAGHLNLLNRKPQLNK